MKNANQIISSLQNQPQFHKLCQFKCIERITSLFMPSFKRFVKFSYIKNSTLFFVLTHNIGKQEFDNNIDNIKTALNLITPEECKDIEIKDIKAFITHTPQKKELKNQNTNEIQRYQERATGNFSIDIKDEKLNELVKSIRDIIRDAT